MDKQKNKQSDFSVIGILISFLLAICLFSFVQFFIEDLNNLYNGSKPIRPTYERLNKLPTLDRNGSVNLPSQPFQSTQKPFSYQGIDYSTYEEANQAFEKSELLPYESRRLVISAIINVPIFILATVLFVLLGRKRTSYRVVTGAFFGSTFVSITSLLFQLASMVYRYNQKVATYGILGVLILVFTIIIVFIQDRHRQAQA